MTTVTFLKNKWTVATGSRIGPKKGVGGWSCTVSLESSTLTVFSVESSAQLVLTQCPQLQTQSFVSSRRAYSNETAPSLPCSTKKPTVGWVRVCWCQFWTYSTKIPTTVSITLLPTNPWRCWGGSLLSRCFTRMKGSVCLRNMCMARSKILINSFEMFSTRSFIIDNSTISTSITTVNSKISNGLNTFPDLSNLSRTNSDGFARFSSRKLTIPSASSTIYVSTGTSFNNNNFHNFLIPRLFRLAQMITILVKLKTTKTAINKGSRT